MSKKVNYSKEELMEIFMRKVFPEPNTGCWLWSGSTVGRDYGRLQIKGLPIRAHRASYFLYYGDFNKELFVLHKCDMPCCVNPEHLFLGTHEDNMLDRQMKNRTVIVYGSQHGQSKLSENDVLSIRSLKGQMTNREISKKFNVKEAQISNVLTGRSWKHLK